jgi:hypothetical protein
MRLLISGGSISFWYRIQHLLYCKTTTATTTVAAAFAFRLWPISTNSVYLSAPYCQEQVNKRLILLPNKRSITNIRSFVTMSMSPTTGRTTRSSRSGRTKRSSTALDDDDADEIETKKSKSTKAIKYTTTKKNVKKEPSRSQPFAVGDEPWYTVFTNGDEQYTEYMRNEWGFEKVRQR